MAARLARRDRNAEGFDQVAIRIPNEFFERIDGHLARMRASAAGVDLKRADALRNLIALGLEAAEASAEKK